MTDKIIKASGGINIKYHEMLDQSHVEGIVLIDPVTGLPYASSGGSLAVSVDNTDVVAAINSQTGTLTALDPDGVIVNAPSGVTGTLVDIKREADTGSIVGYTLFGTNTPYTPVGTLEPFVVAYGSVVVTQSSLPTGAATEASLTSIGAKLDTVHTDLVADNTKLTSIDTKTPALGQALEAQSSPVVLPAAQIATLTPPSNTGYALDGVDATGVTPVTGGVGIRGWLSSIYSKLASSIAITATSLPLPNGAATATLQNDIKTGIQTLAGLSIPAWDTATPTFGTTTDQWVFKLNSAIVWTVTISYTSSTKATVSSITQG